MAIKKLLWLECEIINYNISMEAVKLNNIAVYFSATQTDRPEQLRLHNK